MRKALFLLGILLFASGISAQETTEGALFAVGKKGTQLGACPLKTTSVKAEITGFIARVRVRQEFENTFAEPIEAVYTFPLSHDGAVDQMTMTIGERVVRGKIMKREEARAVYESAKSEGRSAALLDQERPNIFTQSIANIMPGEKIIVEISYVETIKYEDGAYEFAFPMTIGPRYVPGSVKDASKITPPLATRPGHDISIELDLNAGVPVEAIRSASHEIEQINETPAKAKIRLATEKTIPNKDFVLRYDVSGKKIQDAVLAHRDARGGFFTLILQPPDQFSTVDVTPKEIVFVLDTSGSMSGFPIEKAKEAMMLSIDGLHPNDTFNLITFAGDTHVLFDTPVPATQANVEMAKEFLSTRAGGGGTEMMKAIKAALAPSDSKEHVRIVCFMTDGYVGNEEEIIAEVGRHGNARVFSFGIGQSINRYLLDKMAEAGRGEVEYVSLDDDGSKAAKRFYERVRTPLLTDLSIDWNGMPVTDVYPAKLNDLFSAKPVILNGRYTAGAKGTIKLKGKIAGQEYTREIAVDLPASQPAGDVLATLWARQRIDELAHSGDPNAQAEITQLGLEYRLLTANTSFVAVQNQVVNHNGTPTVVEVPAALPAGVDQSFANATVDVSANGGGAISASQVQALPVMNRSPAGLMAASTEVTVAGSSSRKLRRKSRGQGSGTGYGSGNGVGSGVGYGRGTGGGSGVGDGSRSDIKPRPLTENERREKRSKEIFHMRIYAIIERLEKGSAPGPQEAAFVVNGVARIRVVFTDRGALAKLKELGFTASSEKGKTEVTGILPIEKLRELADIGDIKLVLPAF